MNEKPKRFFLGLVEIAGYYNKLSGGFEKIGIEAEFVSLSNHAFEYSRKPSKHILPRVIAFLLKKSRQYSDDFFIRKIFWVSLNAIKIPLLIWAIISYDVFIFSYGTSFFSNHMDLPILKILRKTTIFQFHGSDSRPPYFDGPFIFGTHEIGNEEIASIKKKKNQIDRINKWADYIIDTPTAGHFHTKPFINWLIIGLPCVLPKMPCVETRSGDSHIVRILHSPSFPAIKGTDEIRRIINDLQQDLGQRGYKIEYVEITGQPNDIVINEIELCDLVVDQLFADYGMPGFASEAAAFGKPVVIGGYAATYWQEAESNRVNLPTHFVTPDEVRQTIRQLILDPVALERSSRAHRDFIENKWEASIVAEKYMQIAKGENIDGWFVNPESINYIQGCGVREERIISIIREIIEKYGWGGLQLEDKPQLKQMLLEYIR